MTPRPPRFAIALLEALLPEESREIVVGDLVERFEHVAPSRPVAARIRFWRETLAALPQLQFLPLGATSFTPYTRETIVQSLLTDLRYACRVLWRARGFTAICVATLAVAIGAATTIFSVANPILISSLPYPDPDRLVMIYEREQDGTASRTSYATISDLRAGATVIQYAAAVADWDATFIGTQDAERVKGMRVGWQFLRTLGVRPALGRDFVEGDDVLNAHQLILISHGLWTRRFGGDHSVIGREVDVNGIKRTVIGVMPAGFEDVIEPGANVWRILGYAPTHDSACRTCRHLQFVARLKPGVPREQASREIDGVARRLASEYPKDYATPGALAIGLQDRISENARPIVLALLAAVALLLLIAVANVTNLQLARAIRRQEEFSVRAALGAGRGRLAQQLLAEGFVLAAMGGVAGVALAAVALPAFVAQLPASLPRLDAVRLEWKALLVVAAIVTCVALAMGLAPAWQGGRRRLFDALRGARSVGLAHHRLRAAIVVGEVALAMMLLAGAGLLGRSLMQLLDVDVGFDATNLVTMDLMAAGSRYTVPGAIDANHDRVREAVLAVPGVEDVGLTNQLPMGGNWDRYGVVAKDKPLANTSLAPEADRYTVTPDFLRTMRVPLLQGRLFTEAETRDTALRVAVVSDALAKRIWPGEDAIGKEIQLGGPTRPWWRVIGITGNIRHYGLDVAPSPQVYTAERQWFWEESGVTLVARVRGSAASVAGAIREAVRGVDPLQPIASVRTMDDVIARSTSQRRLGLMLFIAFGAIALLLATAGIYGVLAGSVTERTREFGVRTALGATPVSIAGLVLREGTSLALLGLAIGVAAALIFSRFLRTLLFGVEPGDPLALMAGALAIGFVAVLACLVPARRATRVDPMQALRE